MVVPSTRISGYDHFQITKRRTVSSGIKTINFHSYHQENPQSSLGYCKTVKRVHLINKRYPVQ